MSKTRTRERTEGKRVRVGFTGHRTNLQLSKAELKAMDKAGYRPYWHLEENVPAALDAGYEFVKPEEARSVGEHALHKGNSALGDRVSKVTTKSNPPIVSVLMKIKKKFYEEDRREAEKINAQVDDTLRRGEGIENQYGSVEITRG